MCQPGGLQTSHELEIEKMKRVDETEFWAEICLPACGRHDPKEAQLKNGRQTTRVRRRVDIKARSSDEGFTKLSGQSRRW